MVKYRRVLHLHIAVFQQKCLLQEVSRLARCHFIVYAIQLCTHLHLNFRASLSIFRGCPRGVMVKAMDCGIVVCEFVLQSRYYIHFWANTLAKGMSPLILPAMG